MDKHKITYDAYYSEDYDVESLLFNQECLIYNFVDFLIHDLVRLQYLVMETRTQVNTLAMEFGLADLPYPMTAEDVFDGSSDDHPSMRRYLELFGG